MGNNQIKDENNDIVEKIGPIILDVAIRLTKLEELLMKNNIIDREEYNKELIEAGKNFQGLIDQVLGKKDKSG